MENFMIQKTPLSVLIAGLMAVSAVAQAQTISDNEVRIGVLTDLSGIYSAIEGPGAVVAAKMAVADFGGKVLGKNNV